MKNKLILLLLLLLSSSMSRAQFVTIPDANFVSKLTNLFPNCMNGNQMDTTCASIVNSSVLNIGYSSISDLTGIEYFDNLTIFDLLGAFLSFFLALPIIFV